MKVWGIKSWRLSHENINSTKNAFYHTSSNKTCAGIKLYEKKSTKRYPFNRVAGASFINGQQQKNALMDSLMKQRESIQEMKSSLTERALEKGTNPSSIKEQMKALETQLADIDAQIAQTQKQKQEQDAPTTKKEMNQTPEEAIFSQAGSLEQTKTKTLHRIDRSLTREKAAIESEMKLDASRGVHSEYKANRLIKVEEQMTPVQEELSERIKESPTTIQNNNLSEALTADELSIQEQIRENEIKKSEDSTIITIH